MESHPMIIKVLSNAILSIFMNKSAKKVFFTLQKSRRLQRNSSREPSVIDSKVHPKSVSEAHTPDVKRQALIRIALEAHKKNLKALDGLSEDQKQGLKQLAMNLMFGKTIKRNKAHNKVTKKLPAADTKALAASSATTSTPYIKRQRLIKNAMAAHKKHSKLLSNLSEDQKQKLQLLAINVMFGKINK
jgi:hypothetical protein